MAADTEIDRIDTCSSLKLNVISLPVRDIACRI